MKIVVNEMPENKQLCPCSQWEPNPPFIEEPGYWYCTFGAKDKRNLPRCTLGEQEHQCLWLVQIPPQTQW